MTVEELKQAKAKLEQDMIILIGQFENETGCICEDVNVIHVQSCEFGSMDSEYVFAGLNVSVKVD